MTTIEDKFQQLGNSIINLVSTRASRNIDNLSTVGRTNLDNIINADIATFVNNTAVSALTTTAQTLVSAINELNAAKQDKLTAGGNIIIEKQEGSWIPAVQDSTLADVDAETWSTLAYGDGKLVAFSYCASDGYYLATSTDGTTWTTFAKSGLISYTGLVYDGSKFVALSFEGYVSTSTDGTTWTTSTYVSNLGDGHEWVSLAYDGSKFVALGRKGYISTSTDGTTWSQAAQDTNLGVYNSWTALAYDGTKFVALGSTGYVSTSTDGTTWTQATQVSNLGNHNWLALAYDGSKLVTLSQVGYVSTSTDGTTWTQATQVSNLGSHGWGCLTYDGSKLIALGSNGYLSQYLPGEITVISATVPSPTWGSITGTLSSQTDLQNALNGKQAKLVSGTNIKKINNQSLLGSGNINIDSLPSQTGNNGKFLTTNGSAASWATVDALPSQTGQSGKFLTTNGTNASWTNTTKVTVRDWSVS